MARAFNERDTVDYTTPSGKVIRCKVFAFATNGAVRLEMIDKPESSTLIQPADFKRITLVEKHVRAPYRGIPYECLECGNRWRGKKECPGCGEDRMIEIVEGGF